MKDIFEKNLESGIILEAAVAAGYNARLKVFSRTLQPYGIQVTLNGLVVTYYRPQACFRITAENENRYADIDVIADALQSLYIDNEINVSRNKGRYHCDLIGLSTANEFVAFLQDLENIINDSDNINNSSSRRGATEKGLIFEGSNFSNAHERATTIGNRFMKMVCKASNMSDNYDSEWIVDDGGRIDAVEIDEETEKIVSIYECQSGIQNGDYLDDTHLNKALLRYPADPAIAPTIKKIVILAGGYSKAALETIKWQAENLKITRGIEVILLKTTRTDDKIGVERVELF